MALAQTPSATVDLCNVNNLTAFADFEVHGPLTKLLANTDHQLAGYLELSWLNKHFHPITGLLIYGTVVGDPGTLNVITSNATAFRRVICHTSPYLT
jgi:hypothetical protein